jgi:hypothetical protein
MAGRCACWGWTRAHTARRYAHDALDRELTVRENLYICGRYFGLKRPEIGKRSADADRPRVRHACRGAGACHLPGILFAIPLAT